MLYTTEGYVLMQVETFVQLLIQQRLHIKIMKLMCGPIAYNTI